MHIEYVRSWGIEHRCTRPLLELSDLFVRGSPRFKFDPNKGQPILVMVMTQACCLLVEVHVCVCAGVCVCGGSTPVSKGFAIFQYFSFSVLRQGVQAAHSVLHQRRHWMSAGDIWPDQSDVPAMRPFRFLNSVIHSQRRPYSICHCLKHVWAQRPFHEQKVTNQYEPREQTFCLTSVLPAEIPSWPCRDPGWARQLSHHLWNGSVRSWSEPSESCRFPDRKSGYYGFHHTKVPRWIWNIPNWIGTHFPFF